MLANSMKLNYRPAKHWIIWLIPTRICVEVALFSALSHVVLKILRKNDFVDTSTIIGIRIYMQRMV